MHRKPNKFQRLRKRFGKWTGHMIAVLWSYLVRWTSVCVESRHLAARRKGRHTPRVIARVKKIEARAKRSEGFAFWGQTAGEGVVRPVSDMVLTGDTFMTLTRAA